MRLSLSVTLAIPVVVGTAAALLVVFSDRISPASFPQMLVFIFLIATASFLHARDPAGGVVSSASTLFYVAIYVFDPLTAFLVVALGYAVGNALPRSWVAWRALFNGAQMGMSALVGGLVFKGLGGDPASQVLTSQILPSLLGPLAHQVTNNFFVGFLISKIRNASFIRTWISFVREFFWTNLLSIPTSVLIAVLYARVHEAFILVFLLALPFQRWAMKLVLNERMAYMRIIESLVRACELSLPGARGHARRVADLSVAIARQMGLVESDVESLEYAALLHDIGMIGLDEELGSKNAYSRVEELIAQHSKRGAEIVGELPRRDLREMILNHHVPYRVKSSDKWDPGARVSRGARILALAEDVDSKLFGLFPYQRSYPISDIVRAVIDGRGSVYDPEVVDAFLAVGTGGSEGEPEADVRELRVLGSKES
jgi:putative nucleotidyltransferase with HDIG domain